MFGFKIIRLRDPGPTWAVVMTAGTVFPSPAPGEKFMAVRGAIQRKWAVASPMLLRQPELPRGFRARGPISGGW
jgi:hypothetical protein